MSLLLLLLLLYLYLLELLVHVLHLLLLLIDDLLLLVDMHLHHLGGRRLWRGGNRLPLLPTHEGRRHRS